MFKNPAHRKLFERINSLKTRANSLKIADAIEISFSGDGVLELARDLRPWRKGPFKLNDIFIDSEWQSFIKWDLIAPHIDLNGKIVADVGCNNGYYMFKMLAQNPKKITGFDPGELVYLQYLFIQKLLSGDGNSDKISFELAGVESLPSYKTKFDTIFCLGVLYHRSDPIKTLKELKAGLNPGGEVIIDTLYINRDDELVLSPKSSYAKISNVYFIPSIAALQGWCERAKFKDFEILAERKTDLDEQRKTDWIYGQSLNDFLSSDADSTIEGYEPPKRVYIRLK